MQKNLQDLFIAKLIIALKACVIYLGINVLKDE